tara:strand:- start:3250 stop:5022 length:1773 start_codon:yes stop_codon:yes gene_type:complete
MPDLTPPSLVGSKGMPDTSFPAPVSEREMSDQIWKRIRKAKKAKNVFSREWGRFYSLYAGRHWDKARPEWMSEPVVNLTFSTIETILPILTDNRPQISVIPFEPGDIDIARVLSEIVQYLWEHNDMDIKLPKIVKNVLIFGNGFIKVDWDPTAREGLGEIRMTGIDPENILVDPNGTDDESINWMAHVQNVPKSIVRANPAWAGKMESVSNSAYDSSFTIQRKISSQGGKSGLKPTQYTDTQKKQAFDFTDEPSGALDEDNLVTLVEMWERDPATGSMTKSVLANDILLESGPSPFNHNWFPIVHFMDYPVGWNYWASGEVQHVEKLQLEINKRRGMMIDILKFTSMPMLVVDPTSGVDYENIVTRPGLVIPAIGGPGSVSWLHPPRVPGELFAMNDRDKADFDTILGNVDVLQGRKPAGVEAAAAIEALTEAANTRMRLKVRYMEAALRQIGRLVVSMIQQFYNTERVIRVAGRDAETMLDKELDFFSVNSPTGMGPDGQLVLNNIIPPDAEFDIRIGAGSTLPVSRQSRFTQALQLFQVGAIDQVELLKHSGWPRFEEVIARMEQQKEAQIEAMSAQGGEEGAMGGGL